MILTVLALASSEPEDKSLRVMQVHLMEEYLITLQVYEGLLLLGHAIYISVSIWLNIV